MAVGLGSEVEVHLWGCCVAGRLGMIVGIEPGEEEPLYAVSLDQSGAETPWNAISTLFLYRREFTHVAW